MQAVRSVRSGHRAVRPRTTRVDNRGPLAQRGSAAVIQAVQKRPLASKGVAKAHAKSIRAKPGVRFNVYAQQGAIDRIRIVSQRKTPLHPDSSRRSADTSRTRCRRLPIPYAPAASQCTCRPAPAAAPLTRSPCAARGIPPRRPPATRPGWRPSPWRWWPGRRTRGSSRRWPS